jgi:hypothetical protein
MQNDQLVDASGLGPSIATKVTIALNPLLKTLPTFPGGVSLAGPDLHLEITGNDALESIILPPASDADFDYSDYERVNTIQIRGNKSLVSISSPTGFAAATSFEVAQNDRLTKLDLSSFESFTNLTIDQNPALRSVNVPALRTVDSLVLTNNPQLSTATFAGVRTFESTMDGNADDAAAP